MKIVCIMVASVDGRTTNDTDSSIYHWSSQEDQEYFFSLIQKNKLLIMGRKTYDVAKSMMKHKKGKLRIVFTNTPVAFQSQFLPDMLEFTNKSPIALIKQLETRGYKEALLLGGETINTLFVREHLIDELWLTIEPFLFGKGNLLFQHLPFSIKLQLLSYKKLNKQGTLLAKYKIVK